MPIFLDLIIVFIVLISIFLSVKKGFAATLIEIIGYIVSIFVSYAISAPLARLINTSNGNWSPIVTQILSIIISIFLVSIFVFIIKILSKILTKIFKPTIIGKINSFLGGLLGLVKGVVISFLFCLIISIVLSFNSKGFLIFNYENINATYLFMYLMELSPFI